MASFTFSLNSTTLLVLLLATVSCLQFSFVDSHEFQVGDLKGWVVPPPNDTDIYNIWASNFRFQVGDSIIFKYKKDSVMEVGKENYNDCNATQPTFFSNNGDTEFKFGHSGTFYFISGASGHCEKGQKMIVRVMIQDIHSKSSAYHVPVFSIGVFVFAFVVSFVI
ncbi:early nodulin-like protein 21 [Vicia villosa]|uniref:early nodulin-like protein 21 n=1 Tax=Vicia villosa TaxID=3911 RepID=UPI00273CDE53|nr:early nodulin-like protein 21 [Vicia villosa]